MKCAVTGTPYRVFGYKGKQVRDNIHCHDLVAAVLPFLRRRRARGEVYNIGGGSLQQLLDARGDRALRARSAGSRLKWTYVDDNRIGDHIWWISDVSKFQAHYPGWQLTYDIERIIREIAEEFERRLSAPDGPAPG